MKQDYREWVDTVNLLRANGYRVNVVRRQSDGYNYWEAKIKSGGVKGCFCTVDKEIYHYVNGCIAFDNARCFDKWSKCPVRSLPFPVEDWQKEQLLHLLRYWATEEGFNRSDEYDYVPLMQYVESGNFAELEGRE